MKRLGKLDENGSGYVASEVKAHRPQMLHFAPLLSRRDAYASMRVEMEREEEVNHVPSSELPLAYGNSARAAEGKNLQRKGPPFIISARNCPNHRVQM